MIVSAYSAYLHCYDNGPEFPDNWMITKNFSWNEAFTNELKEYGYPMLEVFNNVVTLAEELQKARDAIDKPFIIHCWVRSIPHNKKAGSTATRSPHINGRAVDFHVKGMTDGAARAKIASLNLNLRIEANTNGWVHVDAGNSYTNDYHWGVFIA